MARHFTPDAFAFLRDLAANNERAWFHENKRRYEDSVRQPALDFITDFAEPLATLSPYFVADSRTVGGSLFRIHRDTRFSKDKTPYKTNIGIQFRHESGKDVHAPGLYFHVDTKDVFLGAGMWHPDAPSLKKIRAAIDEDPAGWKRVTRSKKLLAEWAFEGDSLKRAPKGYDPEHPMIDDLRRKDHIAVLRMKKSDVTRPDLPDYLAKQLAVTKPFMKYLTETVGLRF